MPKRCNKSLFIKIFIPLLLIGLIIVVYIVFNRFHNPNDINNKTGYSDYKLFEQAVRSADTDTDRALSLCMKSGKLENECLVQIAKATIGLQDLDSAILICENISNSEFQGECFFAAAETLFAKDASLALGFCEKSYNHSSHFGSSCYSHFGSFMGGSSNNFSSAILACNSIPFDFRQYCFQGLGIGAGNNINSSTILIMLASSEVPSEFKKDYFFGIGHNLGRNSKVAYAISACQKLPLEWQQNCLDGMIVSIGQHFGGDIDSSIAVCDSVPPNFRMPCLSKLESVIAPFLISNTISYTSFCNKFPFGFRGDCFSGLGNSIGIFFNGDVGSGVSACKLVPLKFRNNCLVSLSWRVGRDGYVSFCTNFSHPYDFICFLSFGGREGSNFSEGADECSSVTDEDSKPWCYRGFGWGLATYYSDKALSALSVCDSLSNENYKFNCSVGVSEGVGDLILNNKNVSFVSGECNKLSGFNSYCYERIGWQAVRFYNYDISKSFDVCNEMDASFRSLCFTGVGRSLGEMFLTNLSFALMKCDELPSPYNVDCKQGLEEMTKFYNVSFVES